MGIEGPFLMKPPGYAGKRSKASCSGPCGASRLPNRSDPTLMGVSSERGGMPHVLCGKGRRGHPSLPEGLEVARPGADGSQGRVGGLARALLGLIQGHQARLHSEAPSAEPEWPRANPEAGPWDGTKS